MKYLNGKNYSYIAVIAIFYQNVYSLVWNFNVLKEKTNEITPNLCCRDNFVETG